MISLSLSVSLFAVYFRKQNILLCCSDNPYMYVRACVCLYLEKGEKEQCSIRMNFLRFCLRFLAVLHVNDEMTE